MAANQGDSMGKKSSTATLTKQEKRELQAVSNWCLSIEKIYQAYPTKRKPKK